MVKFVNDGVPVKVVTRATGIITVPVNIAPDKAAAPKFVRAVAAVEAPVPPLMIPIIPCTPLAEVAVAALPLILILYIALGIVTVPVKVGLLRVGEALGAKLVTSVPLLVIFPDPSPIIMLY
jgi:hypothetical protein